VGLGPHDTTGRVAHRLALRFSDSRASVSGSSGCGRFRSIAMTITVDGKDVEITVPAEAVSIIQDIAGRVTHDRLAFREAKIRMGWIFNLVRGEFLTLSMDEFCELCKVNRRTAYHAMKIAAELGDDLGRFSPAKYRELCRRRRVRPAAKPEELSLRQIEVATGLRIEDDGPGVRVGAYVPGGAARGEMSSVHRCAHLAARLRAAAAALADPTADAMVTAADLDEIEALEDAVFAAERAVGAVLGVV